MPSDSGAGDPHFTSDHCNDICHTHPRTHAQPHRCESKAQLVSH